MTNMNVSLPETLKSYVEEQVTYGGYGTVSEYLRELIREDKKRKAQERLGIVSAGGAGQWRTCSRDVRFLASLMGGVDARKQGKQETGNNP